MSDLQEALNELAYGQNEAAEPWNDAEGVERVRTAMLTLNSLRPKAVPLTVYVTKDGRHQAVVRTCQATRTPNACVLVTMGRVGGFVEEVHIESAPLDRDTLVFTADVECEPDRYTSREEALKDVLSRFLA